jgi:NAD(P)-dependent dehydrogenase (short-subunit alcohol dehydrogenase family)
MAQRLIHRFDPAGGRAIIVYGDVLNRDIMEATVERVLDEFGRVDALINGAGGNSPRATTSPSQEFFDIPEEALRFVFDLNILGTILPSQIFGRHFAKQVKATSSTFLR